MNFSDKLKLKIGFNERKNESGKQGGLTYSLAILDPPPIFAT